MNNNEYERCDEREETRRHVAPPTNQPTGQVNIDMTKLRRDLEASRRLHDEAVAHNARKNAQDTTNEEEVVSHQAPYKVNQHNQQVENKINASLNLANRIPQDKKEKAKQLLEDGAVSVAAALSMAKDSVSEKAKNIDTDEVKDKFSRLGASVKSKTPRSKKPHKPLRERKGMGCLVYILLFFLVLGVAFGTLWAVRSHNTPTPITEIPESERAAVAQEREKDNIYLLVAGTDQRADETSRSDTIIYMALRPSDRKIEMVSLPRDSLVEIPGYGQDKINASLAFGGMPLLLQTVENLVENPVDHTVLINFESFAKIVDAMGGITINVPEKMYLPEEGIDLEAGEQKLNGTDALAFVRWRGDGTGDIGRMERQSQFLQAMTDKARHLMPWQAVRVAWVMTHEIETDLSMFDLIGIAWDFIGMDSSTFERQSLELNPTYINGISYVLLDDYNVNQVIQTMKYGTVIDNGYQNYNSSYGY